MVKLVYGIAHGKTIELRELLDLPEGQEVQVSVRAVSPGTGQWGEGLRRCAGALADEWTEEDDRILEEIYQSRKSSSRREIPE